MKTTEAPAVPDTPPSFSVRLSLTRVCSTTVRFDAPDPKPGELPAHVKNIYVSAYAPGIITCKAIVLQITPEQ